MTGAGGDGVAREGDLRIAGRAPALLLLASPVELGLVDPVLVRGGTRDIVKHVDFLGTCPRCANTLLRSTQGVCILLRAYMHV